MTEVLIVTGALLTIFCIIWLVYREGKGRAKLKIENETQKERNRIMREARKKGARIDADVRDSRERIDRMFDNL